MKLALMLIASWLVASVPISIVLGKVLKRLDSPMPPLLPGDPSFGYSPQPEPTIGGLDAESGKGIGTSRDTSPHIPAKLTAQRKLAANSGGRGRRRTPVS